MSAPAMDLHGLPQARAVLDREAGLLLISVATADTTMREGARRQIRSAVREVMARQFGVAVEAVELLATPGQPPRLQIATRTAAISISHEPGLSVAAVGLHGPVGVDIMRVDDSFDWYAVAKDYLEPEAVRRILLHPDSERALAFAREWTRLEARLKCLGKGLEEQGSARDAAIRCCRTREIELPDRMVGHVAFR